MLGQVNINPINSQANYCYVAQHMPVTVDTLAGASLPKLYPNFTRTGKPDTDSEVILFWDPDIYLDIDLEVAEAEAAHRASTSSVHPGVGGKQTELELRRRLKVQQPRSSELTEEPPFQLHRILCT